MKIYLDMCSIQRPLDTKTQPRIAVEAEAILGIIALCESGQIELLASDALVFETAQNPHPVRKRHGLEVLAKATLFVPTDYRVEERARAYHALGFKPLDALIRLQQSRCRQITSAHVMTDSYDGSKRWTLCRPKSFLPLS